MFNCKLLVIMNTSQPAVVALSSIMNTSQPAVVAQTKDGNGYIHLSWVGYVTCKGSSMSPVKVVVCCGSTCPLCQYEIFLWLRGGHEAIL